MLEAYGLTDPGCVRQNNEDYYLIEPDLGLYVVADGMGGAQAGEEASRLAVETVLEVVRRSASARDGLLQAAFVEANLQVLERAAADTAFQGMGTTLVALLENAGHFEIASVGDSRCYHLANGEMSAVTVDQSWVEDVGRKLGLPEYGALDSVQVVHEQGQTPFVILDLGEHLMDEQGLVQGGGHFCYEDGVV